MQRERVVVIGAGVGGLSSAALLAARGMDVTVLERARAPGGKMREVVVGGRAIDAGPTVFTMRWVFDQIFAEAGADFAAAVTLHPLDVLARHAWDDRQYLEGNQNGGIERRAHCGQDNHPRIAPHREELVTGDA